MCSFISSRKLSEAEEFSKEELKFLTRRVKNGKSDFFSGKLPNVLSLKKAPPKIFLFIHFMVIALIIFSTIDLIIDVYHQPFGIYKFLISEFFLCSAYFCLYQVSFGSCKDIFPKIDLIDYFKFMKKFDKTKVAKFLEVLNTALKETYHVEMPKCVGVYFLLFDKMESKRSEEFLVFYMEKAGIKEFEFNFHKIKNSVVEQIKKNNYSLF